MFNLLPEDRLDLLRAVDVERKWYSLDDKRICVVCDRVITGRQFEIRRDRNGEYTLHCPTPGCSSNFRHWLLCELSPARYQTQLVDGSLSKFNRQLDAA